MMSNKTQKILAIKIIKDKAVLTFEERVIKIDLDTYLNGYYYPGKELDEEEFHYLLENEKLTSAKRYLMTLLSSRPYTEKMIREKLSLKHHLSKEEIETLLSPYLEAKIIDDENYAYSYTEELIEKGYGRKTILSKLSKYLRSFFFAAFNSIRSAPVASAIHCAYFAVKPVCEL